MSSCSGRTGSNTLDGARAELGAGFLPTAIVEQASYKHLDDERIIIVESLTSTLMSKINLISF